MEHDPKREEERLTGVLDRLLSRARAAGAEAADAVIQQSVSVATSYRMGRLEDLERSESGDCGLRVFMGKRQAFVSSTDLSDPALEELAGRAVDMAKIAPEDKFCGLADSDRLARSFPELDLYDANEPASELLVDCAKAAEGTALAIDGITNSEGASAGWGRGTTALATSAGFRGAYSTTSSSIGCAVIAGEGADMQVEYDGISKIYWNDLPSAEEIGKTAAERALRALHPRKVKSQNVPIVFDKRVSAGFLGQLAGAISGTSIARGTSFLKEALETDVFGTHITIIDDPLRKRGLRSHPFDGEGVEAKPLTLIDKGKLTTWLLDSASARQLGLETNGRAARGTGGPPHPSITNLYMAAGPLTPEELMADIKSGLFVTSTFGPNVSLVTGDYSVGVSGQWIENGEPAYPVNEITVAGNLKDMFRHITPASDLEFRRGTNAPTVRIEGMMVAGT
jgi:PmbA protein